MRDTNKEARRTFMITIPGKVADVVCMMVEDFDTTPIEAIRAFYASSTYTNLINEKTKYWHWGAVSLYNDYRDTLPSKDREHP